MLYLHFFLLKYFNFLATKSIRDEIAYKVSTTVRETALFSRIQSYEIHCNLLLRFVTGRCRILRQVAAPFELSVALSRHAWRTETEKTAWSFSFRTKQCYGFETFWYGSVRLAYGSGPCSFHLWLSIYQQKMLFHQFFFIITDYIYISLQRQQF